MSGIPLDALWEIEAGARAPEPHERVALMRALDAVFDELFTVLAVSR